MAAGLLYALWVAGDEGLLRADRKELVRQYGAGGPDPAHVRGPRARPTRGRLKWNRWFRDISHTPSRTYGCGIVDAAPAT
ncbi:hypothetical protein ACWDFL_15105 [Streptomyces bungoensis]